MSTRTHAVAAAVLLVGACGGGGGNDVPDGATTDASDSADASIVDASDANDANDANDASTIDAPDASPDATPDARADASPDASNMNFDLDVVVHPRSVSVWVRELFPSPCYPEEHFLRPGTCELISDYHECMGSLQTCFQRVAVERGGVELARGNLTYDSIWWSSISIYQPSGDLFAGGDVELVIEGCGANLRLPLSRSAAPPAPVETDILWEGAQVRGTIQPTGASGTYANAWGGVSGRHCHDAVDDGWHLPSYPGFAPAINMWLSAIVERPAVTTPWGQARIWIETPEATGHMVAIYGGDATHHEVNQLQSLTATMTIDSSSAPITWIRFGFQDTPSGRRIYINNTGTNAIDYQAGATTDTLAIVRPNGRYVGSFPHVTPTNDMDFAFDGDDRMALAFGPVTLTHESDASLTIQASLDLAWRHPILPRVLP
jgi:hypothetical protein